MPNRSAQTPRPAWSALYETAAAQSGLFTAAQAGTAGYSPQLIAKHVAAGRFVRVRRAIYRFVHFPPGENEDLVAIWLWSECTGAFSHETALFLHNLSDAMPSRAHLTLPTAWSHRRLRVPTGLLVHHADLTKSDLAWVGPVPVTSARRTVNDCAVARVAPDIVRDAFEQGANRGLFRRDTLPDVIDYLKRFYSVSRSRSGPRFGSSASSRKGARSASTRMILRRPR
ncbi:MAG: type IV toxin-antitoxin system AbiEi family antitoxin domain-containing protein [Deltaproteobacteria bacterium]|nr:type IV toxin-antitoxin system AbiEi family antitoxin domain-containing protein [Deltaproteobacteria bacterium]